MVTVQGISMFDSAFGARTLLRLQDATGNVLIWWASGDKSADFTRGEMVTIKGTVKAHAEYKGIKQTTLSRVAMS